MKPPKKPQGQPRGRKGSIRGGIPVAEHRELGPNARRFFFKVDLGVDAIAKEIAKLAQEQESEEK